MVIYSDKSQKKVIELGCLREYLCAPRDKACEEFIVVALVCAVIRLDHTDGVNNTRDTWADILKIYTHRKLTFFSLSDWSWSRQSENSHGHILVTATYLNDKFSITFIHRFFSGCAVFAVCL